MNMDELGGKELLSPALPEVRMAAIFLGQEELIIQGMVTEPTEAEQPEPEPDIRPNSALVNVLIYPAPPGTRPSVEFRMLTIRMIRPVFPIT